MEVPNTNKIMSLAYILALLIVLFFVYKIFKGFGIIKSKDKTKAKEQQKALVTDLRGVEQFDVTYLGKKKDYKTLSSTAISYADILKKAIRGLGTDEEAIFSVFSRLNNKDNISEIALVYKNKYERDLLNDLLNDLTDKEKAQLMTIINQLP
jgi:hypothetical protein